MSGKNPRLFRTLSEPFNTREESDAAVTAFLADVEKARETHKIANVYVILNFTVLDTKGEEGESIALTMYGDSRKGEMLTAYALGRETVGRQEMIARMLKGGQP